MPSFLKYALPRVSTYLEPHSKEVLLPDPTLVSSSCFIVPTSIHLNIPIRYHFILPAHVVQPFRYQNQIVHTDAQYQFFENLKRNKQIDIQRDLRCKVEIIPRDLWSSFPGARMDMTEEELAELAYSGLREYWDKERLKEREQKLYEALRIESDAQMRHKITSHIIDDMKHANFEMESQVLEVELDIANAFVHDRFNVAVAHAIQEPSQEALPSSLLVSQWCDRELDIDDRVYYTGWQFEDVGGTSEQHISPRQWSGRINRLTSTRVATTPDPPSRSGKFHFGMVGGPVFADRGCIGMVEGTVAEKQTTTQKLGYDKPDVSGVMHVSHPFLEKFITDDIEPKMEQRYAGYDQYAVDKDTMIKKMAEMDRDWRDEF